MMPEINMPPMPAEMAAALVKAQRGALAVEKTAKHQHHNYKYVSADDMIAEGRVALGEAGLALFTRGWQFIPLESPVGPDVVGRVIVAYQLVHEGGGSIAWTSSSFVIPGKGRPEDKAEMGAVTENLSYTIRGLLMIPRIDEGASVETRRDEEYEPRRGPAPVQQQRQEPARRPEPSNDAAPAGDTAYGALAAQFKADVNALPSLDGYAELCARLEAAKLPKSTLDDVRAEIATCGLRFAKDADDLDWWCEKLKGWALAKDCEPYRRASEAFADVEERIERDAVQGEQAAA